MFRLEHGEADRSVLRKAMPTLSDIQEAQNAWKDDFALNSLLRRKFRVSGAVEGSREKGTSMPCSVHARQCPQKPGLQGLHPGLHADSRASCP